MRSFWKIWLSLVALGALASVIAWQRWPHHEFEAKNRLRGHPEPAASAAMIADALNPEHPAAASARAPLGDDWVFAVPHKEFQYSLPTSRRSGVDPCAAPAPAVAKVARPLSRGFLFSGDGSAIDAQGNFDLVIHLNGEGPVRRELVESEAPFILYTYTLPPNVSYAPHFAGSRLLQHLIEEITATLARERPNARPAHIALSAWSAGFEGVRSILYQPEAARIEALMLVDGLHSPRGQRALASQLEPFVAFARRAQRGERWFAITHSSIPTYDYTSTTESAHFLVNALGGKPVRVQRDDGFGLELIELYDAGNLHVRGYVGNDKADHCAQLFLMRDLFRALHRHFHP
ncbi:MAG: hypothetical protein ACOY0T_34985 [Myxococcota bacterium]